MFSIWVLLFTCKFPNCTKRWRMVKSNFEDDIKLKNQSLELFFLLSNLLYVKFQFCFLILFYWIYKIDQKWFYQHHKGFLHIEIFEFYTVILFERLHSNSKYLFIVIQKGSRNLSLVVFFLCSRIRAYHLYPSQKIVIQKNSLEYNASKEPFVPLRINQTFRVIRVVMECQLLFFIIYLNSF